MELELILLVSGSGIAAITQYLKRYTEVNPLLVAAFLSIGAGTLFATLSQSGYWDSVSSFATLAFSGSVTVYQILKQALSRG